jgi:Fic family protein
MRFRPDIPYNVPPLPPKGVDLSRTAFAEELVPACVALAELKGYSELLPNPLILLSPAILRESIASSEIENIHTTLIDALQMDLFPGGLERRESEKEVIQYRDAILHGFQETDGLPLSTRLIQQTHAKLLPHHQGRYREQQNRIGNDATGELVYTPPIAPSIPDLMSNWEKFVNTRGDSIDPLIRAALAHYQFEAIHPFADGNGRCGRMIMVLQLVATGVLKWPILYISGYIIRHRPDYYQLLSNVTAKREWEPFIIFLLRGFYEQAVETRSLLFDVMELLNSFKERVRKKRPRIYSHELVEALFSFPITTPTHLGRKLDVHYTTASQYLHQLTTAGFLKDRTSGRQHLYLNTALLELLQKTRPVRPSGALAETIPAT